MIQTVKGKIDNPQSGSSLIHEHISVVSNNFLNAFGNEWLDRNYLVEYAASVLKSLKEKYKLNIFVDGTIMEIGRSASLLKKVSEKSDVNIVASTGFYLFHDFGFDGVSHTYLSDLLLQECINGMDGTDVKPGILKCAGDRNELSDEIIKKHICTAIVQKETGLPVYVHCEHEGNIVFEQIEILKKYGANIEKIIIGHCAKNPSFEYLEEILKKGCCISMDQCLYLPSRKSTITQSLVKAVRNGYGNKILLSNDYCIHSDFSPKHKNGFHISEEEQVKSFGYVFDDLHMAFIADGGKQEDWDMITVNNPIEVLSI